MSAGKSAPGKKGKAKEPPKRAAPFQKAGAGIEAHGVVSELRDHQDGHNVRMSVKHGKAKTGGDGLISTYQDESSFTIPKDAAKHFGHGQRVKVRVHPHSAKK